MYLLKVVIEESGQDVVMGLYSTQFIHIERNLITLQKTGSPHELEYPDTVIIPEDGQVYIMDAGGNTLDRYYG